MQTSNNILLVRPSTFSFNAETAESNAFQIKINESEEIIKEKKLQEFDAFVTKLKSKDVNVFVIDDTEYPPKPDAIFPNNWVSFHADGTPCHQRCDKVRGNNQEIAINVHKWIPRL